MVGRTVPATALRCGTGGMMGDPLWHRQRSYTDSSLP